MNENFKSIYIPDGPKSFSVYDKSFRLMLKQKKYQNGVYWYGLGEFRCGTLLALAHDGKFHAIDLFHAQDEDMCECDENGNYDISGKIENVFDNLDQVLGCQSKDLAYMAKKYKKFIGKELSEFTPVETRGYSDKKQCSSVKQEAHKSLDCG